MRDHMAAKNKRTANDEEKDASNQRLWQNRFVVGSALTLTLAAVAFVVIAFFQWKSLHAIERLISATQRPWITASVEPVNLVFDDQGGQLTIKATLTNYGQVPAVNILMGTVLLLKDPKLSYRKACAEHGIGGGFGPALGKDEKYATTAKAWLSRGDFGKTFPSLVAVCIKYRSAFGSKAGEAGFLFSLVRHAPPQPDLYWIDTKNGAFSPPELLLAPIASYQY